MNWKTEAVEKLRQYKAKKNAIQNIPEELARIESANVSIRSPSFDDAPVSAGGSRREDMLLSNIVMQEELERCLEQARKWVALVDAGLENLTANERLILERFYINPCVGAAEKLAEELAVDIKTVYHRKDVALRRFTISLYGCVEC